MTTHDIREGRCGACGARIECATNASKSEHVAPSPGDFFVCIECGAFNRVETNGRYALLVRIPLEVNEADRRQMLHTQAIIRTFRRVKPCRS